MTLAIVTLSCNKDKPTLPTVEGRNVLAYYVADNNLYKFAITDINEMEYAWDENNNGKLYVFLNKSGGESVLYEISHDNDPTKITSKIIETYPKEFDPCDPVNFRSVVDQVHTLYPAKNRGLILWSHGSGWLNAGTRYPYQSNQNTPSFAMSKLDYVIKKEMPSSPANYSFGGTTTFGTEIEVYQIAETLNELKFDFITFDACYMACVEIAYQLRHNATYFFASAAEVFATSSPYDKITNMMFEPQLNMPEIALECFKYYDNQSGSNRSSTYSVVKCSELSALAVAVRDVLTKKIPSASNIQQFGRSPFQDVFFDLQDFVEKNYSNSTGLDNFKIALNNAIVYKATTAILFNEIKVKTHCGLTSYIPLPTQPKTLKTYRERYSWSKDSGLGEIF